MYEYKCRLIRAVDGDTVECDVDLGFSIVLARQKIRMARIDTR